MRVLLKFVWKIFCKVEPVYYRYLIASLTTCVTFIKTVIQINCLINHGLPASGLSLNCSQARFNQDYDLYYCASTALHLALALI